MDTGIYQIRNLINGKRYIGSASRSFIYRWNKHCNKLNQKQHHSKYLQNAWNKHGEENFAFEILLYCALVGKIKSSEHKLKLSQANYGKFAGDKNPQAKMTNDDVLKIKQLLFKGLTQKDIAIQFNISISTVSRIKLNKLWSSV